MQPLPFPLLSEASQKRLHRLRMRLMFLRDPVRFAPYYRLSVLLVFSHVTSNIINQQLEQASSGTGTGQDQQ